MVLKQQMDLIGTFCIVKALIKLLYASLNSFNRNILYCKALNHFLLTLPLFHLIGTFCIVKNGNVEVEYVDSPI